MSQSSPSLSLSPLTRFAGREMQGIEYIVLHVQEPILYVIRKQLRSSPTQVTALADYYVLAGIVYQAPDLLSVVSSRFTTCAHHLVSAFDETLSFMRYHPTKGYCWDFGKEAASGSGGKTKEKEKGKEKVRATDFGSAFQRRRVDMLLSELSKRFPPKTASLAEASGDSGTLKEAGKRQGSEAATAPAAKQARLT